jgi:hypothetical protein
MILAGGIVTLLFQSSLSKSKRDDPKKRFGKKLLLNAGNRVLSPFVLRFVNSAIILEFIINTSVVRINSGKMVPNKAFRKANTFRQNPLHRL